MVALMRQAVREELAAAGLERPAPLPIGMTIDVAAEFMSVHPDTIRSMVRTGELRTMDLGGRRRTVIPTVALFELDPGFDPKGPGLRVLDAGLMSDTVGEVHDITGDAA